MESLDRDTFLQTARDLGPDSVEADPPRQTPGRLMPGGPSPGISFTVGAAGLEPATRAPSARALAGLRYAPSAH